VSLPAADAGPAAEAGRAPLPDGHYRDDATDRWPRVGLLSVAAVLVVALVVVQGDALGLALAGTGAAAALGLRALLLRPRLVVGPAGLRLVGLMRTRRLAWSQVAGAGARAVPGPLGRVEQCLVVHGERGRSTRVRVVRGPVDPATGVAGAVAELAAGLVARARVETGSARHAEVGHVGVPSQPAPPAAAGADDATLVSLLAFLAEHVGGVPRPLGADEHGREVWARARGAQVGVPLPGWVWTDRALVSAAVHLRRLHDVSAGWVLPAAPRWGAPVREPAEVVLHGAVTPASVSWEAGRVVGLSGWQGAHPGPRVADVAGVALAFVPLRPGGDPVEQGRRLALLADAYGLEAPATLPVEAAAAAERAGDAASAAWVREHAAALAAALT